MRGFARSLRYTLLAVVALMVTALTPLSAEAAVPPAPVVGSCYSYGWATFNSWSDTSTPVPCAGAHTARAVFVGRLWTNEPYSTLLSDAKMAGYMAAQCQAPFQRAIGTWKTVSVAGYQMSTYYPTQAQYTAGARWFRCDITLPGVNNLYPIPNRTPEAVPLSPGQSRCIHLNSQGGVAVACAAPHSYRAAGAIAYPGTAYPSRTAWVAFAKAHCSAYTRSPYWYATWASSIRWSAGDHYLTCYRATTA